MKPILIIAVSICLMTSYILHAQDAIYKKDKTKIDAKVLEVGNWDIKYKAASNPDGPVYTLPKSDIVIIIYQNGTSDIFSSTEKTSCKKFDSLSVNFCRNFIGIDIGEFTNNAVNMTYEHTFGKKGSFALRLPFSVGVMQRDYYYGYGNQKILSTGLDFLFFPTGQGKVRYYAAPYAEFGMYHYRGIFYYEDYYNPNNPYNFYYTGYRFEGGVKNGILFQPTRHFSVSADLGFGIKNEDGSYNRATPTTRANLLLGYRF